MAWVSCHDPTIPSRSPRLLRMTRLLRVNGLAAATLTLLAGLSSAAAAEPAPLGATVPDFALRDARGQEHRLPDAEAAPVVVLAALGTECPLAKLYAPRLEEISQRFADRGVAFLGLDANAQDAPTELAAYARDHGLTFPLLKDVNAAAVDAAGLTRTPEVVVLDADRKVRYRGRIDDQYGIGYAKDAAGESYLTEAIEAVLAGRPVARPQVEPIGCLIGRPRRPQPDADVTYAGDVAAVLNKRCVSCHRDGEIAPFALTDYDAAAGWSEMIAEVVREDRMPPWHAAPTDGVADAGPGQPAAFLPGVSYSNDRRLPAKEKDLLVRWAAAAPRGTGDAPQPPAKPVEGWRLPRKPDVVLPIADAPVAVPAEGAVRYRYFKIDPEFTEDKWVAASEILPGNRAVVHHVLVFARPAGQRDAGGEGGAGFLAAYVPGLGSAVYPPGMAKRVPAGSELRLPGPLHAERQPAGRLSKLGLVFADPASVTREIETRAVVGHRLDIQPNAADQRFAAHGRIADDGAELFGLNPHMHLRGQAFRYTLASADGAEGVLLDVPEYDFNWQTATPSRSRCRCRRGDVIACEAWFDNTADNPANPDPSPRPLGRADLGRDDDRLLRRLRPADGRRRSARRAGPRDDGQVRREQQRRDRQGRGRRQAPPAARPARPRRRRPRHRRGAAAAVRAAVGAGCDPQRLRSRPIMTTPASEIVTSSATYFAGVIAAHWSWAKRT